MCWPKKQKVLGDRKKYVTRSFIIYSLTSNTSFLRLFSPIGSGPLHYWCYEIPVRHARTHTHIHARARTRAHTHTHSLGLLWMSYRPSNTIRRNRHPWRQRDSNPKPRQASDHRFRHRSIGGWWNDRRWCGWWDTYKAVIRRSVCWRAWRERIIGISRLR